MQLTSIKAVLIVILLGVVSNAVWRWCEPMLAFATKWVVRLFSKLFKKFGDSLYEEISKGLHEKIGYTIFYWLCATASAVLVFFLICRVWFYKSFEQFGNEVFKSPENTNHFMWFISIYFGISVLAIVIYQIRTKFINDSIGCFNQLLRICRPYMTEDEFNQVVSKFSQIKNRADYSSTIDPLKKICEINNLKTTESWSNL